MSFMVNFMNSYNKFVFGLEQINAAAAKYPAQFVHEMEKMYKQEVTFVVDYLLDHKRNCKIIMLAGPSSSGKTTTAYLLKKELISRGKNAVIISLDDFYLGGGKYPISEDGTCNFEAVEALDVDLVNKCLLDLFKYGYCDVPQFDFKVRARSDEKRHVELNNGFAIVEGIHALNPIFTNTIAKEGLVKLYISVKQGIKDYSGEILSRNDIRLIRRLVRDYNHRSTQPEETFSMWASVSRGETLYIYPFKKTSDLTINSLHLYEMCVLSQTAIPLLHNISEDSIFFRFSRRLLSAMERFYPIQEDLVPQDSLLREFIS